MSILEEEIFSHATTLSAADRPNYLANECSGNEALRQRIEKLLIAHEREDSFLDLPEKQSAVGGIGMVEVGHEIGPYRLLKQLGEGGFGVVFLAEQQHPMKRKVAIKIIKPGMDSRSVIARFESERQVLAIMDHPNIARIFEGGTSENKYPYFVMELVQGVPITEFCNSNKLTISERLSLFITVCNAVHHAHQKGIIHRDLKPNNVMVTEHDGEPVVKVIDFGVAKALHQTPDGNQHQHQHGVIVGTPQYMSPEQAGRAGFDVDTRSDVFSLSVLLYELLTGSTPLDVETLQAADFQETLRLIQQVAPPTPSTRLALSGERLNTLAGQRGIAPRKLLRVVNGDLDCIVMKGLEKKRRRRYETARDLAMDVQRFLTDHPVLARPPSLAYQSKKFVSRNRIGLIIAATAACALVAMLFGMVNHRRHQLAAVQHAEKRLNIAVDEANSALLAAIEASNSSDHWATVDLMASQVAKLANDSSVGPDTRVRSEVFLQHFNEASQNREFTSSMEALLVNFSTKKQTVESLTAMEQGFRRILRNRGYDFDTMTASEIAVRLKSDHAPIKLTDALELWLSTRIKLGTASDNKITATEIKAWTEAMITADPNPLRTAIRATIFGARDADVSLLDQAVASSDLKQMCARKLSWLSQAYQMVGETERSAEILDDALAMHSNDLMLNFEHAVRLMDQKRTGEAIRYLMRCTSIRPGNASVWKKLAIAFWQNNEAAQAIKAIKKAIELDSNDPELRHLLSKWLSQVDNHQ